MKSKIIGIAAISAAAILALGACSDDDDADDITVVSPTPSASATTKAGEQLIDLTCPAPVGNVTVKTTEGQWDPGYVVGSDVVLYPVAFGEITFVNTTTGEKHTEAAVAKPGADPTGAVECPFHGDIKDEVGEDGKTFDGTIDGTVTVKTTPSP